MCLLNFQDFAAYSLTGSYTNMLSESCPVAIFFFTGGYCQRFVHDRFIHNLIYLVVCQI